MPRIEPILTNRANPATLRIDPDFYLVVITDGTEEKIDNIERVRELRPELFAQLTVQHFVDCAARYPELAPACAPFITELNNQPR